MYSMPALVALSFLTFFFVKGMVGVLGKERETRRLARGLESEVAALVVREKELRKDIGLLETEEGVQNEIRGKFSVTREGEYVAIIVDDRRSSTSTDNLALPWYKKFWNVIMPPYGK